MSEDLATVRAELDAVDRHLIALLARRAQLVARAWDLKRDQGLQLHDASRESVIFARLLAQAEADGLDSVRIRAVLERIVGVDLRRDR